MRAFVLNVPLMKVDDMVQPQIKLHVVRSNKSDYFNVACKSPMDSKGQK